MKPTWNNRKSYGRMKSRHPRNVLGFDRYEVLWRNSERMTKRGVVVGYEKSSDRANALMGRSYKHLWETDPKVYFQSRMPKPYGGKFSHRDFDLSVDW